jgi:hypothetical protein
MLQRGMAAQCVDQVVVLLMLIRLYRVCGVCGVRAHSHGHPGAASSAKRAFRPQENCSEALVLHSVLLALPVASLHDPDCAAFLRH